MRAYRVTEKTGALAGIAIAEDDRDVMLINLAGTIIRIHVAGISTMGRTASGVRLMRADADNPVVGLTTLAHSEEAEEVSKEAIAEGLAENEAEALAEESLAEAENAENGDNAGDDEGDFGEEVVPEEGAADDVEDEEDGEDGGEQELPEEE